MKSLSIIQSLFICIFLSSCVSLTPIPIPLFPEEPYQDKELKFLKPGETTRAEIREHLNEPLAIRNNGKLLLYENHSASWFTPTNDVWYFIAFLFIEMNEDDRLNRFEVIRNKEGFFRETQGCTSWGICLDIEALEGYRVEARVDDATFIFLEAQLEKSELEHPLDGQCQIITYLDNKSWLMTSRIQIDDKPKRSISKKGFLKNIVSPGNHTLTAEWPLKYQKNYSSPDPIRQNVSCNSGESFFVNVFISGGLLVWERPKINLKIESAEEGLKIVGERQLIID